MESRDALTSRPRKAPASARRTEESARDVRADRERSYRISWLEELSRLDEELCEQLDDRSALLVTTPTVARLYAEPLFERIRSRADVALEVMPLTESTKTLANVEALCRRAKEHGLGRSGVLVGFGGGVCTDVVTTAASLLRRGIAHMRIPTTLLGIVDAGVGCKGAVNFAGSKNHLGCFYPAERVFLCPRTLPTLSVRHLRSGMAEVVKVALASDVPLFEDLEQDGAALIAARFRDRPDIAKRILWRSVLRLLDDLEPNLFEDRTLVRRLDFGHTFSPVLEARSDYSLTHGEAVAIDMAFSTVLARELGRLSEEDEARIHRLFTRLELPRTSSLLTEELLTTAVTEAVRHRGGALNLFVPTAIGTSECLVDAGDVPPACLAAALRRLAELTEAA